MDDDTTPWACTICGRIYDRVLGTDEEEERLMHAAVIYVCPDCEAEGV